MTQGRSYETVLTIVIIAVIGTTLYQVRWSRGVSYEAVASAIAHGQIDLQ